MLAVFSFKMIVAPLLLVLAILVIFFWASQFLSLMRMEDDEFPGRYDKPLWFVAVFLVSLLGALLFWLWKRGRTS